MVKKKPKIETPKTIEKRVKRGIKILKDHGMEVKQKKKNKRK